MPFYLVTGGAGFIGSHLTEELRRRGDRVRVFDNLATGKRRNLGTFKTRAAAEQHEREVQYFKRH